MELQLQSLALSFKNKPHVIDNISLTMSSGSIVGIVAPNGTGKTTLLRLILNDLKPQSGKVVLDGQTYGSQKQSLAMHRQMCLFPVQDDLYPDLSGKAHLEYYARLWHNRKKSVKQIITALDMHDYVNQPVRTYSMGMKQRLCFGMVMAANTPIMLLDEFMNGLDTINVARMSRILRGLRAEGKLIITVSHLLNNLQGYADLIYFMRDGKIIKTIDQHEQQPLYIQVAADNANRLPRMPWQHYPNGLLVLSVNELPGQHFNQLLLGLAAHHIAFKLAPLDLDTYFNEFYEAER
ncbi:MULTISPECIES: ATP-binding cassette domain-containing protein [Lacticaseibacillus]|uniref:Multidrug ABC transporter ATP-binding component n=1 Tax=Lacticaseibacillus casei DSM 20011 = JCM 1134 = ATCC 393 TaxID=1423732 RepID=A0AAD1AR93_LACCA|nr:ABC transporter ATP-binding protein [Lacticaseibacillus casei]MBI6598043.1 ABC transporter ATP-binding protein [Lacticaseibacillus casei]MBO1481920.1 ABC transporter ATP-binding protein [Lacticaseibacillus casei]MBO2417222.1 ABC transporter ATP-binding protein [Lacticaseibacillus casei]MCK2081380.1 ABC transporter ATP-binding protein [Lacticaseibacillus casei]MDZ5496166.1 ABC transporter ATP-binding protein [Lacticaseibacillus casei]